MTSTKTLTPQQRRILSASAMCDDRTVKRAYSGKPIRLSTLDRLRAAAKKHGIQTPG